MRDPSLRPALFTRQAVVLVVAFAPVLGCGSPTDLDGEAVEVIAPAPTRAELPPEPGAPEPITGEDGALLESTERFNGLALPRGLEVVAEEERHRVYRTRSSVALVLGYLGPRLSTAEVERTARGEATYRNATVTGVSGGSSMDVSIAPTSGSYTRIEISLAPPEALAVPSEEELRQRLEALATTAE